MAHSRGTPAPVSTSTHPHAVESALHLSHEQLALGVVCALFVLALYAWGRRASRPERREARRTERRIARRMRRQHKRLMTAVASGSVPAGAGPARPGRRGSGILAWAWAFTSGIELFERGQAGGEDGDQGGRRPGRRRLARAGARLGLLALLLLSVYTYAAAPRQSGAQWGRAVLVLGCLLAAVGGYRLVDGVIGYRHHRDWVRPLHLALHEHLGYAESARPRDYLHVPRNFTELTGEAITVQLPQKFHGDAAEQQKIRQILMTKLGLQDVVFSWRLDGRNHHLSIVQAPRPRTTALFSDPFVRRLIEGAPESAPLIGLSHRDKRVAVDLDAESPHILVSASTGGGKSVILRTVFAQLLHRGALGVVLDFKRHSHKWVRGVPGVDYHRDIADIHDALIALGEEGHRRNIIVDDWEGEDDRDAPVGPRLVILLEEANATIAKLKKYWAATRQKDDPKSSPALDALGEILYMGRAVRIHVLMVAQSATANALGGPEMRECFSTRILARYTQNAWRMLVPEVFPIPKSSRHVGRAQVVLGGVAQETQVIFYSSAEAREYAMAGRVAAPVGGGPASPPVSVSDVRTPSDLGQDQGDVSDGLAASGSHLSLVPDLPEELEGITLRQAVEDKVVSMELPNIQRASNRDPEFPESVGLSGKAKLYRPTDLMKWERNRPSNRKAG